MVNSKERQLLVSIRNDDTSALRILFENYHQLLCSVAHRIVRDPDVAKDIVQDVFVKFWNNRKTTEITLSLSAYLKRSVINTALNELEKIQRHRKADLINIPPDSLVQHGDQEFAHQELSRQLENAIDKLPIRTRAVFVLIRNEEMSYKEVGESLDISVKAVEKEMMKALRLLRGLLKDFLPVFLMAGIF